MGTVEETSTAGHDFRGLKQLPIADDFQHAGAYETALHQGHSYVEPSMGEQQGKLREGSHVDPFDDFSTTSRGGTDQFKRVV